MKKPNGRGVTLSPTEGRVFQSEAEVRLAWTVGEVFQASSGALQSRHHFRKGARILCTFHHAGHNNICVLEA